MISIGGESAIIAAPIPESGIIMNRSQMSRCSRSNIVCLEDSDFGPDSPATSQESSANSKFNKAVNLRMTQFLTLRRYDFQLIAYWLDRWLASLQLSSQIRIVESMELPLLKIVSIISEGAMEPIAQCLMNFHRSSTMLTSLGVVAVFPRPFNPMGLIFENISQSLLNTNSENQRWARTDSRAIRAAERCLFRFSFMGVLESEALSFLASDIIGANDLTTGHLLPDVSYASFYKCMPHLLRAFESGAGWLIPSKDTLFVIPRPVIMTNEKFELHCADDAAIVWRNGRREYWWNGVRVPSQVITHPQDLDILEVLSESNNEVRRVMVERYGLERLFQDASPEVLDVDTDSGGKRELLKVSLPFDEPLLMVRVRCASTGRLFLLRVPPRTHTCAQGIAWMFGFEEPKDYHPAFET